MLDFDFRFEGIEFARLWCRARVLENPFVRKCLSKNALAAEIPQFWENSVCKEEILITHNLLCCAFD